MASWQRYPGAWSPQEEEEAARFAGRSGASAPALRSDEHEEEKENGRDGRSQRPPPYYFAPPSYGRTRAAPPQEQPPLHQPYPGYPPVPPQGYAGYSSDVHERQHRYDQWLYQGSAPHPAPVQQPTSGRGQWLQQNHRGLWVPRPEAAQLDERRQSWGHAPSSQRRAPGFLLATLRLCVFHVINVFFALAACGVLAAGLCSAASLIPVCCVGLLIFQVIVYITFSLAQWDITLANYIAPAHQCAYSNLLPPGRFVGREGLSGYRIAPSLAFFSPLSLMAMLYFVLVKPVIGALSVLSVLLVVAPTASFVTSLAAPDHGGSYDSIQIYGVGPTSMSRYPGLSLVGAICVTLLGVALMQLVAKISLGATRFFCCEKFAVTARFAPYQYQPLSSGVASYGTTS